MSLLTPVILTTQNPQEIKPIITHTFGKGIWDAKAILETLNTELHVRERLSVNSQNENSEKENPWYSTFSLYSNSNNHKMFCLFCWGTTNHKTVSRSLMLWHVRENKMDAVFYVSEKEKFKCLIVIQSTMFRFVLSGNKNFKKRL